MKNEKPAFYVKQGRRYYPVDGDIYMPANGIWLVELNGNSKRVIMKLDEIPQFNTPEYISLQAQCHGDLCSYLFYKRVEHIIETFTMDGEVVRWSDKSNSDFANDIIKFLSLDGDKRNDVIEDLKSKYYKLLKDWDDKWKITIGDSNRRPDILFFTEEGEVVVNTNIKHLDHVKFRKDYDRLKERLEVMETIMKELNV